MLASEAIVNSSVKVTTVQSYRPVLFIEVGKEMFFIK